MTCGGKAAEQCRSEGVRAAFAVPRHRRVWRLPTYEEGEFYGDFLLIIRIVTMVAFYGRVPLQNSMVKASNNGVGNYYGDCNGYYAMTMVMVIIRMMPNDRTTINSRYN